MAIETKHHGARAISLHREPDGLLFDPPNVHPGRYLIPSVDADEKILANCVFTVANNPPHQYAKKANAHGSDYIELNILDAKTFIYTPGVQKVDEYGAKLEPDVQRFGMPIPAEELANEIERLYGHMGIVAIPGATPTEKELKAAKDKRLAWMQTVITDTNKYYKLLGDRQVTDQSRRVAWELHKLGRLTPLPEWAVINPSAEMMAETFNCKACGTVLRNSAVRCNCGAIYDWKAAVDFGMVKPADVPPSKRAEAGLDEHTPAPKIEQKKAAA